MVRISRVESKKDLKAFVKLPFSLYGKCPQWVPPFISEELAAFDPAKNPMCQNSEARIFLASRNGRLVGRIAGILSHTANQKNGSRNLRFGWFDTIEDLEVAEALLGTLETWAKELGMDTITGPQGFSDFDRQGMLISGFDQVATIAANYNFPYYSQFMEACGYGKGADYVEYQLLARDHEKLPEELTRYSNIVQKRSGLRLLQGFPKKYLLENSDAIGAIVNESYESLYGTIPFTPEQFKYYLRKYLPLMDTRLIRVLLDRQANPVGFVMAMHNLSAACQKAGGRLLPTGWYHLSRQLKRSPGVDIYLVGLLNRYRGSGAPYLMIGDLFQHLLENYEAAETNPILESNRLMRAVVEVGKAKLHKRRRVFVKRISAPA